MKPKPHKQERMNFLLRLIGSMWFILMFLVLQANGVFREFFRLVKPILPALVLAHAILFFDPNSFIILLTLCVIMYHLTIIEKKVENSLPHY